MGWFTFLFLIPSVLLADGDFLFVPGDKFPDKAMADFAKKIGKKTILVVDLVNPDSQSETRWLAKKMGAYGAKREQFAAAPPSSEWVTPQGKATFVQILRQVDGIYFAGNAEDGNANALLGSELQSALVDKFKGGALIAGYGSGVTALGAGMPYLVKRNFFGDDTDVYRLIEEFLKTKHELGLGLSRRSAQLVSEGTVKGYGYGITPDFQSVLLMRGEEKDSVILRIVEPKDTIRLKDYADIKCRPSGLRADSQKARLLLSGKSVRDAEYAKAIEWVGGKEKAKILFVPWGHDSVDYLVDGAKERIAARGVNLEEQLRISPTYIEMFEGAPVKRTLKNEKTGKTVEVERPAPKDFAESLEWANIIVFSGGSQKRFMQVFEQFAHLGLREKFDKAVRSGTVYAGGSAGAAVASDATFTGKRVIDDEDPYVTHLRSGLRLLKGVNFDSHFDARESRMARLVGSLRPESTDGVSKSDIGIGLGEDSTVVVESGKATVFGTMPVYVVKKISNKAFHIQRLSQGNQVNLDTCTPSSAQTPSGLTGPRTHK